MSDPTAGWSFETKQVHAGATSDPTTGARDARGRGRGRFVDALELHSHLANIGNVRIEDLKADLDAGFRAAKGA